MIYIISFSVAIAALLGWFLVQKNDVLARMFRIALGAAVIIYGITVLEADLELIQKFPIVFRDLLILGSVGVLGTLLSQKKLLTPVSTIAILAGLNILLLPQLTDSFELKNTSRIDHISTLDNTLNPLAEDGELLVELTENQLLKADETFEEFIRENNFKVRTAFQPQDAKLTLLDNYRVIDIPENQRQQLEQIKYELSSLSGVVHVEDNEVITLDDLESQPVTIDKSGFAVNDPGLEFSWGFAPMKVNDLYTHLIKNKIRPFKKARLAILDTGIDAKHEDISNNYVSTQSKYDDDPKGHGTHCAGIAASVSNNGVGIASFALSNQFVEVTSIKVLSAYGIGTQQGIIKGMIEAADSGADVISMSLGGRSSDSKQRAYDKAIRYANKKGAIVVVAAGNSNRNAKEYSPANSKGVITVSAIDAELQRAIFSNYVNDLDMGIAAPGVNIYSLIPNNKYATYNGTSMATPYVAGLIALMKSINPDLDTQEAYQILNDTGIDTKNTTETGKLIQPHRAMMMVMD